LKLNKHFNNFEAFILINKDEIFKENRLLLILNLKIEGRNQLAIIFSFGYNNDY